MLALFWGNIPINAHCQSYWDEFLKQPDNGALVRLGKNITAGVQRCCPAFYKVDKLGKSCDLGNPENRKVIPTEEQDFQLFELISKGNEVAFRAGLLLATSKCLDGGELEDLYRSLGLFFETQPRVFLQTVKDKSITDSNLKSMLVMLPLETTDKIDLKMFMIKNRISILENISDGLLKGIKEKGLSFLSKAKENLDRIKVEIDKANGQDSDKTD